MRWWSAVREAVRGVLFRGRADAELHDELRFHLNMEAERLVRDEGLSPAEARRRARIVFGSVDAHAEEVRAARGLAWLSGMTLDFRLGLRMLIRSWGLTVVGGAGMALAIALGAGFHAATQVVHTPLPFDADGRIVALENWDAERSNQERRIQFDFAVWRDGLTAIEHVAAYRTTTRNLIAADGTAEPVTVAEMSASGFPAAGVPPLLGRTLAGEDEAPGAPPVVVIGSDVWRTRFHADPSVIGRELRLGAAVHTVVGVMPDGFAFPINHRYWVPLRADLAAVEPRTGPSMHVFGRLAPGASLASARNELATLGTHAAASYPGTHRHLRPRVVPYTAHLFDDMEGWEIPLMHVLLTLLLLVICANVAVLVYARTASRTGEIAVRSALGASRRRIVGQLFLETAVLAAAAAVAGLTAAQLGLDHLNGLLRDWGGPDGLGGAPFWIEFRLGAGTVLYVLGLAVLGAVVIGVVPALRAAGGSVQPALRQLSGGTGLQLGRTWNALIVAQVAITVACLPAAISASWKFIRHATAQPGFAAHEYAGGYLALDRQSAPALAAAASPGSIQAQVAGRLAAEPGVAAFTFADDLPGQEPTLRVAADGGPYGSAHTGTRVRFARVDPGYFDAFQLPVIRGRGFHPGDASDRSHSVVVSRSFAEEVLGGLDVLGRRIRYLEGYRSGGVVRMPAGIDSTGWYEVIGIVPDFPRPIDPDEVTARVYHPFAAGEALPRTVMVHASGRPELLLPRLRRLAADVHPGLLVRDLRTLDQVFGEMQAGMRMAGLTVVLLVLSVLLLSAAGIYALMSFTVVRRRREIGIRVALGADPGRLLGSIFARAVRQLGAGVALGLVVAAVLELASGGALLDGRAAVLLPLVAAIMMVVGLLATSGPARRGLRIQPTEALREE
jgi:putative ABC transport system permease protein